jgi:anti-sigma-K factor RskA
VNIEDYIASGILEAYALGELTEQERASVEEALMRYPVLREELAKIEATQEALLMSIAIAPPAGVKQAVLDSIPDATIRSLDATRVRFWQYAAAACLLIAITASYLAYSYRSQWQSSEKNLSELIAQNQQIARDYNSVNLRLDKMEEEFRITNNPAFTRIVMTGTPQAPDALASVYWNASTQEVYLSLQQMKALAQQNQYQLWAIVDGKPVDAGVFDGATEGLIKMKQLPAGATAFAVTIEPRGGRPVPTLEAMQVIGNVIKG